jgi:uncharacterized protein YndB with AHSA1/START domain
MTKLATYAAVVALGFVLSALPSQAQDAKPAPTEATRKALADRAWGYLKTMYNKAAPRDDRAQLKAGWGPKSMNVPYTALVLQSLHGTERRAAESAGEAQNGRMNRFHGHLLCKSLYAADERGMRMRMKLPVASKSFKSHAHGGGLSMPDEFTTSAFIPALPMAVYLAWLDGAKHSEMTGADAHVEAAIGGPYDAWDGYIHGTTLALDPGRRIVQRWRTAEFPGDAPDSTIELTLTPEGNGSRLSIKHTGIPEGQGKLYESGWQDHYFRPMQEYFIHAGISGVPHGASVTEILHRVSTGQASPSSPSLPVFRDPPKQPDGHMGIHESDEVADAPEPAQVVEEHEPTGNTDFELADESDEDDFDTSKPAQEQTGSEDFWKHLDAPPREPAAPAPVVEAKHPEGRRPARRAVVGAGKPRKSNNTKGRKKAARSGQSAAAPKKPAPSAARKSGGTRKRPAKAKHKSPERKRRVSKRKPKKTAKKQIKARRVSGGGKKRKVVRPKNDRRAIKPKTQKKVATKKAKAIKKRLAKKLAKKPTKKHAAKKKKK